MKRPNIIHPSGGDGMSPARTEVIKLLRDALASAESGEIDACVLVACGPVDFGIAIAGADAPRLNLGLDAAKRTILEKTTPSPGRTVLHR
jgi:hypothetical protein